VANLLSAVGERSPTNGAMEKVERKQARKEKLVSDTYLLMPDPELPGTVTAGKSLAG
jgi:hypothetical protein